MLLVVDWATAVTRAGRGRRSGRSIWSGGSNRRVHVLYCFMSLALAHSYIKCTSIQCSRSYFTTLQLGELSVTVISSNFTANSLIGEFVSCIVSWASHWHIRIAALTALSWADSSCRALSCSHRADTSSFWIEIHLGWGPYDRQHTMSAPLHEHWSRLVFGKWYLSIYQIPCLEFIDPPWVSVMGHEKPVTIVMATEYCNIVLIYWLVVFYSK